ncbi:MAG: twin-arginine translocase subunit TatC [Pseudomonadota bacterium]
MDNHDEARMGFLDHLEELRSRLIRAVIAILIGFSVCMYFSEDVIRLLSKPLTKLLPQGSGALIFTGLPDPFFMYIKVSFICSFFITLPFVLHQIWMFVKPGLYPHERRLSAPFISFATLLFYAGAAFCYSIVLPAAFQFFLSFESPELKPMIAIKEYVSLIMVLMLAFGLVFETPIVIVFLGLLGVFDTAQLKKGRRYFIVLAFVIGAILTPTPDPLNQSLMAVPMILLYEVGIWVLRLFEKRRAKQEAAEAAEDA